MSSYQARLSTRIFALLLCVVFALSGCALFNPYVRSSKLDAPTQGWGSGAERLPKAIDAAIHQRSLYYEAISERAKLRNGLPLVLIPLSAVALYRGVTTTTDSGRRMVLKMGLAGAGLYGAASYYTVSPKERIYLAGVEALSCSIHAVEPLMFGAAELARFDQDLKELDGAMRKVESARDEVAKQAAPFIRKGQDPSVIEGYSTELARATPLLARGREVHTAGRQLQAQVNLAARNLRGAIERIVKQVNDQLEASEPDPSTILRLGSSLGNIASQIAHVSADAFQPRADVKGDARTLEAAFVRPLADAIESLKDANNKLFAATDKVAAFTAVAAAMAKHASGVEACQVARAAGDLRVDPDLETKDLNPNDTLVLTVRSSMGIPDATLGGVLRNASRAKDAVALVKTVEGNALIVRVTYLEAQEGVNEAILTLTGNDRGTTRKQIRLNLRPAAAPQPEKKAEKGKTDTAKAAAKKKPAKAPAAAPKTPPAPTPAAPVTDPSAAAVTPAPAPAASGRRDDELGPTGAAAANAYETKELTIGALKQVQKKLRTIDPTLTESGEFDLKTRAAIRRVQERRKNEGAKVEINGELSRLVTKDILSMK